MKCEFEKNIYTPMETAHAKVKIDNSECQIGCNDVKFFVEQRLTIRAGSGWSNHQHCIEKKLVSDKKHGPAAGEGDYEATMDLELDKIKYTVEDFKKKKGVQKKVSPEDRFMMAGVQPACHSKHITNEYFLVAETSYDGCTCCAETPDSRMPLTIVPLVNPECFGFKPQSDYQPHELGFF